MIFVKHIDHFLFHVTYKNIYNYFTLSIYVILNIFNQIKMYKQNYNYLHYQYI